MPSGAGENSVRITVNALEHQRSITQSNLLAIGHARFDMTNSSNSKGAAHPCSLASIFINGVARKVTMLRTQMKVY